MKLSFYFLVLSLLLLSYSCSNNVNSTSEEDSLINLNIPDSSITLNEFQGIHICTELFPPIIKNDVDTFYFSPSEKRTDTLYQTLAPPKASAAMLKQYLWHKNILYVSFLDGDPEVEQKVINAAKQWENYCGIRFNFGNYSNPDITISFKYDGSWSYIGSYSQQTRPSMNFGWLYANTSPEEYNRVVLHEFGHALGLIHEHQQPNANIPWDSAKVYRYYSKPPNNWDVSKVNENIFKKYNYEETNFTDFDSLSIMLYGIPSALTKNGYHTEDNYKLSNLDEYLISQVYPK